MVSLSVILPTYNEQENIEELINRVLASTENVVEVIVVDDDSPDKTWEIAEKKAAKDPRVKVIRRTDERGLPSAIADGIDAAKGEAVAWMDCDLCHTPELLPKMLKQLPEYDIATGSRFVSGGKDKRPPLRVMISLFINGLCILLLGGGIRDYSTGFLLAKKSVIDDVPLIRKGYGEYCIDLLYRAKKKGYTIKEVGYIFTERERGVSKTSPGIKTSLTHFMGYIQKIIELRLYGR